ncbi:MAG: clamp loader of DNA polymerase [Wendovervirus sonii]|uniref:Clamp loader of DNA polymerase n=1 Tax=phage Lak_Megaphage_Sonny TaxID=3109229 RepID=A0ABZ0Z3K2_9CAUD|nr:MAG: clamp loader of DNA polymerase [phage Lak_Megaphage_Sonny]
MAENIENTVNDLFTERFRPQTLEQAVIVPRIREELSKGLIDNQLYYGKPGCGKTTLSRIMAKSGADPLFINASLERGIDTIRDKVIEYASVNSLFDGEELLKVVVLEECDNLTNDAWSSLRATIEQFCSTVRFIANCNYIDKVPDPIKSRFNCIPLEPINKEEETYLFNEYCKRASLIMNACQIQNTPELIQQFVSAYFPDMRTIIKKIQQMYTRKITELTPDAVGMTFDCPEIFNMIINDINPVENYKMLAGKWGNRADDAILTIGKQFPDYMISVCPDKIHKLPSVIMAIAEYQSQLPHAIDKFVVLAALMYRLQMIMHS